MHCDDSNFSALTSLYQPRRRLKPRKSADPLYRLLREGNSEEFNRRSKAGETSDLRGGDFRGIDLRGLDLRSCRMEGASPHAIR
jgi:uncharacterized protein YjbI with pentapeptide repeats